MKDLVKIEALREPYDLTNLTENVLCLMDALSCFLDVSILRDQVAGSLTGCFPAPLQWLAILIVRSSTDLEAIFSVLETTSLLGALEREKVEKLKFAEIEVNPKELQKEKFEQQHYGFWLPHGMHLDDWEEKTFRRHAAVRRAYTMLSGGGWEETEFSGSESS